MLRSMIGDVLVGATVLDLGAGSGVAASALLAVGAARVVAVEPDPSDSVGLGALARASVGREITPVRAFGEALPVAGGSMDVVYCRQVLHHTMDLASTLRECARLAPRRRLRVLAARHVVDDDAQLARFLADHPVHQLAGGDTRTDWTNTGRDRQRTALTPSRARPVGLDHQCGAHRGFPSCRSGGPLRSSSLGATARSVGCLVPCRASNSLPGVVSAGHTWTPLLVRGHQALTNGYR